MQLNNINNFQQGAAVRPINSPRSLEACLRAGLDPSELLPVERDEFATAGLTEKMIDIKFEAFERKRNENIKLVTKERDAIIAYMEKKHSKTGGGSPNANGVTGGTDGGKKSSLVELEEKRMEALRKRQKEEMNKLIEKEKALVVLQQKMAHTEAEEAKKKKLHDKKVLEQKAAAMRKAAQIAAEVAKKEAEEAEMRRQLDKKEQEHSRKVQRERAEMEKRIMKEARLRDIERAEKAEAHRKHTEALIDAQTKLAEQNREKMMERERRVQEQLELKKERKRQEVARQREEATKRMEEALAKHEEAQEKKKKEFQESEAKALERAKEHEKEKMEELRKQANDRDKRNTLRFSRLVDAYKARKEKREDIIARRSQKDSIFSTLQQQRNEHVAMLKFMTDLTMEDKQANVERVARVNEFRRLQMLRKIESEDQRFEQIKADKRALQHKHLDEVKNTLIRKHEVSNAMETMRATNDFSLLDQLFQGKKKGKAMDADDDGKGPATEKDRMNATV